MSSQNRILRSGRQVPLRADPVPGGWNGGEQPSTDHEAVLDEGSAIGAADDQGVVAAAERDDDEAPVQSRTDEHEASSSLSDPPPTSRDTSSAVIEASVERDDSSAVLGTSVEINSSAAANAASVEHSPSAVVETSVEFNPSAAAEASVEHVLSTGDAESTDASADNISEWTTPSRRHSNRPSSPTSSSGQGPWSTSKRPRNGKTTTS